MSTDGTPNTITLPAGTYTLTIPGALEFGSAAGSLDVNGGNLTIAGAGADATIIDANHLDPVLALCPDLATSCGGHGVPNVVVRGVTLRNGGGSSDVVAVKNQGTLALVESVVTQSLSLFKGNKSDYRLTTPVAAQLTLPETGLCLAVTYASSPPAPRCTTNPAGTRLACQ